MFQTTLLWQNDDRWANDPLGHGPQTIKEWGCLMTSLAMVVNGFGYDETPQTFNEKMKNAGGFAGPLIRPGAVPATFPGVTMQGRDNCEDAPAPLATIDAAFGRGLPVILQVDWSPVPGLQSHWVVGCGREGDDYVILDPYRSRGDEPGKIVRLLERYPHRGASLEQAITGAIYLAGSPSARPGPAAPAGGAQPGAAPRPKVPAAGEALVVAPTGAGLALRTQPNLSAGVRKRFPITAQLIVLDPAAEAAPKVGVEGQWLRVRDIAGDEGYVAAWYVTPADDPALGVKTSPPDRSAPPEPPRLVVRTTHDQVALRRAPRIALDTLLKRLPLRAELLLLDPADEDRIGLNDQWLRVRDLHGIEGFVAAWYVAP